MSDKHKARHHEAQPIIGALQAVMARRKPMLFFTLPPLAALLVGSSLVLGKPAEQPSARGAHKRLSRARFVFSQAYGSIHNFDVVNDTGNECHGFEIEINDCRSTDISYTYDWNHYGTPRITEDLSDPAHPKTYVRYESGKNADGTWKATTIIPPHPLAPTDGHQFIDPSINIGGEHFGVGFSGDPAGVKYSWLKDDGNGNLVFAGAVTVGTPGFGYAPPAANAPALVQAMIQPPPPPEVPKLEFGEAVWVRETRTVSHNNNRVELRELVTDDPDDPNDPDWTNGEPDEVEVEWALLQEEFSKANGGANGELFGEPEELPDGDEIITRRYDFFEYTGPLDDESGEAKSSKVADDGKHGVGVKIINGKEVDLSKIEVVGNFIGAQMSAFDAQSQMGLIDHVQDGEIDTEYVGRRMVIGGVSPITIKRTGSLPPGMQFDTATGILSGAPTAAGVFTFRVTATDTVGTTVAKDYLLRIVDPNAPQDQSDTVTTVSNASGITGTKVALSATVLHMNDGTAVVGNPVDFQIAGISVGVGTTDNNGTARIDYSIPATAAPGDYALRAVYAGDAQTRPSSGDATLGVRIGATLAVSNVNTTYLAKPTFQATLKAKGVGLGGKSVEFRVGGVSIGSATTSSTGIAKITALVTQAVGDHTVTAVFAGDGNYAAATSAPGLLRVGKGISVVSPSGTSVKYGANGVLKATLKIGSTPIDGEVLEFRLDGVSVGTATTNATGTASVSTKVTAAVGNHTITAAYVGSTVFQAATKDAILKVTKAAPKIIADALKAKAGTAVAFGAVLRRSTDSALLPGQTVAFHDAATGGLLGTGQTDANGRAVVTLNAPAVGVKRTIQVRYAGDANHDPGTASGSLTGQ